MSIAIPPLEATCHSLNGWWSLTNDENQDNLKYDPEYEDQESELKNFKGQKVCSGYTYSDKNLNINAYVYGKTFVKPGKYDSLYPDAEYYVKNTNTKMGLKLKLLNYAIKAYRSDTYVVFIFVYEFLLTVFVYLPAIIISVCEDEDDEDDKKGA
ncbi:Uncharacterised protein [Anaerostipes hadrus]|uniref:Uncharacterized protein n=1 Tax=Anaerostipes hadrus TaxID=649756 RepID=A0A174NVS6_ANAHA|nr:Uncharacterised protein [Anaerostipes hadrus]